MKSVWGKVYPFLPAGVWYAVIFWFSAQTGHSSGAMSDRLAGWLLRWWRPSFFLQSAEKQAAVFETVTFCIRKGAHMGVYFILSGLLLAAVWRLVVSARGRAAAVFILCALLAGLDEFHQTFVSGRSGQLRDVLIDLAGCACFLLLWGAVSRFKRRGRGSAGAV